MDDLLRQAWEAFQRDWPDLVREHEGEWVAYRGCQRIAFGATRPALWEECLRRGLPEGAFWVLHIQQEAGEEVIGLGDGRMEEIED